MMLRFSDYSEKMAKRPDDNCDDIKKSVSEILEKVRVGGDGALRELAKRFDSSDLDSLFVSDDEIDNSGGKLSPALREAIDRASLNIRKFHEAQIPEGERVETTPGVVCSRKIVPIEKVGLYVPGGTAPLFSTVLMLAIPASVASCPDVMMATPARNGVISPAVLYAAKVSGVHRILKVGGAQAIAAFAYGTESVTKRDKIFGPGNRYVTEAKAIVSSFVSIDMVAGPSEVMVVADESTRPAYAAADLLSQAEHGKDSQVILIIRASDRDGARKIYLKIEEEIEKLCRSLERREMIESSLSHSSAFPVYDNGTLLKRINEYAPEHLIIETDDADEIFEGVRNAGSVFLGHYTPEAAGDYASGTNHTLPTSGWAVSSSGVSVDSFIKKITVQRITEEGIRNLGRTIEEMASAEGLGAHREAVRRRYD